MVLMQVRLMTSSSFSYIVTMFCRLQSFASTECLDYSRSTPRRVLRSTTYPWRMDVCPASLFFWKQSLGYKRWTPDDTDMMTNTFKKGCWRWGAFACPLLRRSRSHLLGCCLLPSWTGFYSCSWGCHSYIEVSLNWRKYWFWGFSKIFLSTAGALVVTTV